MKGNKNQFFKRGNSLEAISLERESTVLKKNQAKGYKKKYHRRRLSPMSSFMAIKKNQKLIQIVQKITLGFIGLGDQEQSGEDNTLALEITRHA